MSRTAHVKDLTRLGRNISTTLIVDNCSENFRNQKENGIHIQSWFGNSDDNVLYELENILMQMAFADPPDVRKYIYHFFTKNNVKDLYLY
jgi:TFIIF-interacting CTD phosphatase-like protein